MVSVTDPSNDSLIVQMPQLDCSSCNAKSSAMADRRNLPSHQNSLTGFCNLLFNVRRLLIVSEGQEMSSFMSNCESCNYLIAKDSVCSNCGHHPEGSDGSDVDVIEEFARRKDTHNRNSLILMSIKMIGALGAFIGSTGAIWGRMARSAARSRHRLEHRLEEAESSFINYEAIAVVGLIIVAIFVLVTIYHLFIEKSDSILPAALCCPKCEERLDQLNIKYDQCPSCCVHLQ
jgi:hypothetical protein